MVLSRAWSTDCIREHEETHCLRNSAIDIARTAPSTSSKCTISPLSVSPSQYSSSSTTSPDLDTTRSARGNRELRHARWQVNSSRGSKHTAQQITHCSWSSQLKSSGVPRGDFSIDITGPFGEPIILSPANHPSQTTHHHNLEGATCWRTKLSRREVRTDGHGWWGFLVTIVGQFSRGLSEAGAHLGRRSGRCACELVPPVHICHCLSDRFN